MTREAGQDSPWPMSPERAFGNLKKLDTESAFSSSQGGFDSRLVGSFRRNTAVIRKKALVVAIAVASSAMLFGCGGGGGSSSGKKDPAPENPGTERLLLTGMVSKGTVSFAKVEAFELDANGNILRSVGSTQTDANGRYELQLDASYKGGIIKLTVTPTSDSRMACDVFEGCGETGFGETLQLPVSFALNAYVPPPAGNTVTAAVTPLTHMAAKRFEAMAKTPNNLNNVIDSVNRMTGFDILTTEPVDLSKAGSVTSANSDAQAYALFNSGLAALIFKDGAGAALDNLEKLAQSFEDGKFDSTDDIKITDITSAVSKAATQASTQPELQGALTEAVGKVNERVILIEQNTDENGNYEPKAPDTAGKTKLQRGQEAIADLRTWINEALIQDFSSPLDNYALQLQTVGETFDGDTQAAAQLAGFLVEQVAAYLEDGANVEALLANGSATLPITGNGLSLGSLNLTASATGGLSLGLNGELLGEAGRTVKVSNFTLRTNLPASSLENGEPVRFSGDNVELTLSGAIESGETLLELKSVQVKVEATETVSVEANSTADAGDIGDKFKSASFNGPILVRSGEHSFEGEASFNLVRLDRSSLPYRSDVPMGLGNISVSGAFTGPTGALEAGATLSITNGMTFDTFGLLDWERHLYWHDSFAGEVPEIKSAIDQAINGYLGNSGQAVYRSYYASYYSQWSHSAGIQFNYVADDAARTRYETCLQDPYNWLQTQHGVSWPGAGQDQCLQYETISHTLDAWEHPFADQIVPNVLPALMAEDVTTSIKEIEYLYLSYSPWSDYTSLLVEATQNEYENRDYFLQGSLTLNTKVSRIQDLPELNLIATVSRDKIFGGSARLTLGWDSKVYTLEFTSDDLRPEGTTAKGTLTIKDGTGVVIELTSDNLDDRRSVRGSVKVDGEEIGTVSTESGIPIVRFQDGKETRFESLIDPGNGGGGSGTGGQNPTTGATGVI